MINSPAKYKNNDCILLIFILFSTTILIAQHQVITLPPKVSPMPMKPEMTEIWEPQVVVVTPGGKNTDAPSDAIILFDGKNLDQWVSQKDSKKTAPWKIVNNEYMEVVIGSGGIQTKMLFAVLFIISNK